MTDLSELKKTLSALTVDETGALVPILEEAWGVKVPSGGPTSGGLLLDLQGTPAPAPAAKTDFIVELTGVADSTKKIQVIQAVRKLTGLDLKAAKTLVDTAPAQVFPDSVDKDKAEAAKTELEAAGGQVTIK